MTKDSVWICMYMNIYILWVVMLLMWSVRVRARWERRVFEYVCVWIFIHSELLCWWCDSTSTSWMTKDSVWICICINIYILWVVNSDDVISMSTSWMRKDNVYCLVVARTEPFTQPVMATRRSASLSRKSLRKMPSMCFRYIIKRLTLL